jgi:hypothetical protein
MGFSGRFVRKRNWLMDDAWNLFVALSCNDERIQLNREDGNSIGEMPARCSIGRLNAVDTPFGLLRGTRDCRKF